MIILQRIWEKWSKKASDTTGMVPVRLSTNNFITNFSTDCNLLTTCCVYILKTTCHMTRLYLIYALIVILAVGLEVDTCCMSASPSPWHLIHGWLLRETVMWRPWHLLFSCRVHLFSRVMYQTPDCCCARNCLLIITQDCKDNSATSRQESWWRPKLDSTNCLK